MLSFVGESHFDLDGYARVRRMLTVLDPRVISLEHTARHYGDIQEAIGFLRTVSIDDVLAERWGYFEQRIPGVNQDTLTEYVANAYFVERAVEDHRNTREVPLIFADDGPAVDRWMAQSTSVDDPISPLTARQVPLELRRFLSLSPERARADVAREYASESYPVADRPEMVAFYRDRDAHMEGVIRQTIGELLSARIVHISGLDHLFGDYHPNLFDRFEDLAPKRYKLSQAASELFEP